MSKESLPGLISEITSESISSFVDDTKFAVQAQGAFKTLSAERANSELPAIEIPGPANIVGESALRNSKGLVGGVMAAIVLRTMLRNFKLPLGG